MCRLNPDMGELQCCEGHLSQILQPAGCHSGGQSGRLLRLPGSQSCSLVRSPSGDVLVFCSGRPAPPAVFDDKSAAFLCNDKLAAAAPAPQALIPLVMDLPPFHISDGITSAAASPVALAPLGGGFSALLQTGCVIDLRWQLRRLHGPRKQQPGY